ncbi:unnamed protein product [Tetraodon nigroviridis]|uniref:Chromosome undetermined SCAF5124, whole genome shotgun sequence n=1 Tax=Tetraodon nigroviridis TaxID=99883 RepID=Q4TEU1_TETNG|nr:unnamed protein product [Tetraodon nigroviridis]
MQCHQSSTQVHCLVCVEPHQCLIMSFLLVKDLLEPALSSSVMLLVFKHQ